jgi:ESF2/ABP1 family protein
MHAARLRLELSQSRSEQREYLKNVDLARVLDKREQRSQAAGKEFKRKEVNKRSRREGGTKDGIDGESKRPRMDETSSLQLASVLGSVF